IKSFFSAILGYDKTNGTVTEGILGNVKAYYGCVKSQGRGTLHCHMMIWLEGGHDPNEIKQCIVEANDTDFHDRLLAFLDDTISNEIPADPDAEMTVPSMDHHPCSVHGVAPKSDVDGEENKLARQKDMHHLVKACQVHKHNLTCFKYWKGPPHPRECRFDLDEKHHCAKSSVDYETGEICLCCLDGMVNNFNASMLEAVHCNMDIKFIGSGASAKAILYYITGYITKSQLKAHVAYATLDMARQKLSEFDPADNELTIHAKELIRKSAHTMISHQELSSQQVAAYLMDFGDHYTSHKYVNVFWTLFENYVDAMMPLPKPSTENEHSDNTELEDDDIRSAHEADDEQAHSSQPPLDEDILQDIADGALASNEVSLSIGDNGALIPRANQVQDYQLRSPALQEMCIWDFVAQVEKQKVNQSRIEVDADLPNSEAVPEDDLVDGLEGDFANMEDVPLSDLILNKNNTNMNDKRISIEDIMKDRSHTRPSYELHKGHIERGTHCLVVCHPDRHHIPVPIGPSLPRRDRLEVRERYC
ncbi:hypothetical protein F4604DRAFT_1571508, partial [Suillus subluteus]